MADMRYQPQGRVCINRRNPIAAGLVFAHTPASLQNALPLTTKFGIAAQRAKIIPEFSEKPGSQALPEVTVLGVAMRNGTNNTASNQYFLRLRPTGNANGNFLGIGTEPYQGMNQVRLALQYSDFTNVGITGNFPANPAGQQTIVIGTVSAASLTMSLWADGNVIATGPAQNKTLFSGATTAFMGDASGNTDNTGIPNLLCAMWTRVLSPAEIKSITANPWQLFEAVESDEAELAQSSGGVGATVAALWTEQNEASALSGVVTASAAASWAEQGESVALAGAVSASASAAWTEANETTGAAATVRVIAAASWTESGETSAAAAIATAAASVGWAEGSEAHSASASVGASAAINAAWVEGAETVAAAANVKVSVAMGWGEAGETHAALATARINAAAGWAEQSDAVGVSAQVPASTGSVDVSTISPARMVVFEGSGSRVVTFEGSGSRVVRFE